MKGKACKAREIITTIWVAENAKQRNTVPCWVVCVVCASFCSVLFLFGLLVDVPKHVNIPWCVLYPVKISLNPAQAEHTRSVVDSGVSVVGIALQRGGLSFCLLPPPSSKRSPKSYSHHQLPRLTPTSPSSEAVNLFLHT